MITINNKSDFEVLISLTSEADGSVMPFPENCSIFLWVDPCREVEYKNFTLNEDRTIATVYVDDHTFNDGYLKGAVECTEINEEFRNGEKVVRFPLSLDVKLDGGSSHFDYQASGVAVVMGALNGVSPTIEVSVDTDTEYKLKIKDVNGEIETPNLKGSGGGGGTGQDGATFTPAMDQSVENEVTISFTNNKQLPNPDPVTLVAPIGQQGAKGDDGASAYEVAVDEGFVGTKAQWLESLKGEDANVDRPYEDGSQKGLGYIVLEMNLVDGVNTLTQSMVDAPNTIYVVRYDFLVSGDITLPKSSTLIFEGGSISGKIDGLIGKYFKTNFTEDKAYNYKLLSFAILSGMLIDLEGQVVNTIWSDKLISSSLMVQNGTLNIDSTIGTMIETPSIKDDGGKIILKNLTISSTSDKRLISTPDEKSNSLFEIIDIDNCEFDTNIRPFYLAFIDTKFDENLIGIRSINITNNYIETPTGLSFTVLDGWHGSILVDNNFVHNLYSSVFYFAQTNTYDHVGNVEKLGTAYFINNNVISDLGVFARPNAPSYIVPFLYEGRELQFRNNTVKGVVAFNSESRAYYSSVIDLLVEGNTIENVYNLNNNSNPQPIEGETPPTNTIFMNKGVPYGYEGNIFKVINNRVKIERDFYQNALKLCPEVPDEEQYYNVELYTLLSFFTSEVDSWFFENNDLNLECVLMCLSASQTIKSVFINNNNIEVFNFSSFKDASEILDIKSDVVFMSNKGSDAKIHICNNTVTGTNTKPLLMSWVGNRTEGDSSKSISLLIKDNVYNNVLPFWSETNTSPLLGSRDLYCDFSNIVYNTQEVIADSNLCAFGAFKKIHIKNNPNFINYLVGDAIFDITTGFTTIGYSDSVLYRYLKHNTKSGYVYSLDMVTLDNQDIWIDFIRTDALIAIKTNKPEWFTTSASTLENGLTLRFYAENNSAKGALVFMRTDDEISLSFGTSSSNVIKSLRQRSQSINEAPLRQIEKEFTQAEWDALTAEQKAMYDTAYIVT